MIVAAGQNEAAIWDLSKGGPCKQVRFTPYKVSYCYTSSASRAPAFADHFFFSICFRCFWEREGVLVGPLPALGDKYMFEYCNGAREFVPLQSFSKRAGVSLVLFRCRVQSEGRVMSFGPLD